MNPPKEGLAQSKLDWVELIKFKIGQVGNLARLCNRVDIESGEGVEELVNDAEGLAEIVKPSDLTHEELFFIAYKLYPGILTTVEGLVGRRSAPWYEKYKDALDEFVEETQPRCHIDRQEWKEALAGLDVGTSPAAFEVPQATVAVSPSTVELSPATVVDLMDEPIPDAFSTSWSPLGQTMSPSATLVTTPTAQTTTGGGISPAGILTMGGRSDNVKRELHTLAEEGKSLCILEG